MTPERWEQIQELLHEAIVREADERSRYLDAACGDDRSLRGEVEELLLAHYRPGTLDSLASGPLAPLVAGLRRPGFDTADPIPTPPRFTDLERLGGGGMGVVYRARDSMLDRTVALKFLPRQLGSDGDAKARFIAEAQAAAALEHPNICTVYEIGETGDGQLYMAMPFYEGETLKERIARGPLPVAHALAIALDVARGLGKAHERGIVHRDIKPANVVITTDGLVKILDFGIAKLGGVNVTQPGALLGTVAYMSPEQAASDAVDQRTDVWSLGVVLYEMLAGARPFRGDDPRAVLYAIQSSDPQPIRARRDDIPVALDALLAKALAKRPADRFQSMRAFIDEMTSLEFLLTPAAHAAPLYSPPVPGGAGGTSLALDDERRDVTVLVSILSGYASLIERCAPEEVERVTSRLRNVTVDVIRRHGGHIEELDGDRLRAIFGIPEMHEDDAVRAMRAALALHHAVREVADSTADGPAHTIRMQSGVHTGSVVVQRVRRPGRDYKVAGTAVNGATRLASLAMSDAILTSPECQRLVAPFFATRECAPVLLDAGAPPITPYIVHGESGHSTRLEAAIGTGLTPYTGRGVELAALESRLDEARRGEGRFVAVVGDVGAGKSRLLYELRRGVDEAGVRVLRGRCQSYGGTTPYLPFIEALRDLLGVGAHDRDEYAAEALAGKVRAVDPSLESCIPLYLHLLSIPTDSYPVPRHLQGERFQAAMLDALVAVFTMCSRERPTLILFEDWHWVDVASRDVLRQLVAMLPTCPLLVVVSCRPDDVIDWGSAEHQTTIHLGPLDRDASVAIMRSVLHAERISPHLVRQVHERTGGNPFFLEEVCQTLLEEGTLTVADGEVVATDASGAVHFPATVQAVIRSRLDRLQRDEREVLRVASVIGREFARDVLEYVLAGAIDASRPLDRLASAGLVQQTSVMPEPNYRFKHVLTQEVTYETLLEHQRRTLHGAVGRALEKLRPDVETRLELLARHFSRAELWRDAVSYGIRAAERATALSQFSDALVALERSQSWLLHLADDDERRERLAEILLRQERLCETLGLRGRQQQLVDDLIALLAPAGSSAMLAEAYLRQGDIYTLLRRFDAADRALGTALRITRERGDAAGERNALRSIGLLRWHEGDNAGALALAENALQIDREHHEEHAAAGDLANIGILLKNMGELDRARDVLEEALAMNVVNEDPLKRSFVFHNLANVYRALGDNDKALVYLRRANELAAEPKLPIQRSFHLTAMAHIHLQQGSVDEALRVYGQAVELSRTAHHADGLAQELRMLGELLFGLGRFAEALPHFTEAIGLFAQLEDRRSEAAMWSRVAGIHEREGAFDEAGAAWRTARSLHRRIEDARAELEALEGMARCARRCNAADATALYEEAVGLAAASGDLYREGSLHNQLGILNWERARYTGALRHYETALRIFRDLDDRVHEGLILNSIGATLQRLLRYEEARTVLEQGLAINRQTQERLLEAHSLAALGNVYRAIGRLDEAGAHYASALELRRALGDPGGEGWMLYELAGVCRQRGAHEEAERYSSRARELAESSGNSKLLAACAVLPEEATRARTSRT
jgi:tetratricopeptide (TPR) repeat protein/class 3 adenylate cyclase